MEPFDKARLQAQLQRLAESDHSGDSPCLREIDTLLTDIHGCLGGHCESKSAPSTPHGWRTRRGTLHIRRGVYHGSPPSEACMEKLPASSPHRGSLDQTFAFPDSHSTPLGSYEPMAQAHSASFLTGSGATSRKTAVLWSTTKPAGAIPAVQGNSAPLCIPSIALQNGTHSLVLSTPSFLSVQEAPSHKTTQVSQSASSPISRSLPTGSAASPCLLSFAVLKTATSTSMPVPQDFFVSLRQDSPGDVSRGQVESSSAAGTPNNTCLGEIPKTLDTDVTLGAGRSAINEVSQDSTLEPQILGLPEDMLEALDGLESLAMVIKTLPVPQHSSHLTNHEDSPYAENSYIDVQSGNETGSRGSVLGLSLTEEPQKDPADSSSLRPSRTDTLPPAELERSSDMSADSPSPRPSKLPTIGGIGVTRSASTPLSSTGSKFPVLPRRLASEQRAASFEAKTKIKAAANSGGLLRHSTSRPGKIRSLKSFLRPRRSECPPVPLSGP